jgi:hypothetical protein
VLEALLLSSLVLTLVFLLQWRFGFNWADEGWLWYGSQRTALREVPLRDFFSYDPGRYYWSAFVFKIFGGNGFFEQLVANYLFGTIGLTLTYMAMIHAGMGRWWRISILLLLGTISGFPRHKIYEQTLSLVAVAAVAFLFAAPQRLKRWLLLGVLTGLAAFIGRNSGLFCLIASVLAFGLLRRRRASPAVARVCTAFGAGIIIGYSPMIFMIVFVHNFFHPFFQSVLLTPHWAWSLPIPFPWHVHLHSLHGVDLLQARAVSWLCIAVPVTYAFLLWRAFRSDVQLSPVESLAVSASCAGAGFLFHAFYTADFFHIAQGVVAFVVAGGAFSTHLWHTGARRSSLAVFCLLAPLALACWIPMEPLFQYSRTKARAPDEVRRINIGGDNFDVPAKQAAVMETVANSFRNCGAHDGGFLAAPYYPGLYASLGTRSPLWDTYFLWHRDEETQKAEIAALQEYHTSLVLLNAASPMNGREGLKFENTNPMLLQYIVSHYARSDLKLPDGFDLYYSPQDCKNAVPTTLRESKRPSDD